jgi:ribosomal protein L37AE/L43A
MIRAIEYNADKPHRCPNCHVITDEKLRCRWAVVTCCRCGVSFTKHPKLAPILLRLGIVCPEHRKTRRWK